MRELGAKDQADRRAMVLSLLNLPEAVASQDLSYSQAESLIAALRA